MPEKTRFDKPSAARIYDYMLGGYHNFEVDRVVAEKMIAVHPDVCLGARANRAFLRRAVTFLVESGIDQFLDLGSGIPTVGNVHEAAQAINPATRVVYVDIDPVAVSHSKTMLKENPKATAIRADVRQIDTILEAPEVCQLLDFEQPMAVLLVTVLHYVIDDERAYEIMDTLHQALAPGSYIAIAHSVDEIESPGRQELRRLFGRASSTRNRSEEQIAKFFDGFELVEPGQVHTPLWRPEGPDDIYFDRPEQAFTMAGVARRS